MVVYPSGKTYPPSGGGLTWEEIKQKLESEGAKNKAYDGDVDGLVENIRFKEVAELPDAPRDYEVVVLNSILRVYDPAKSTWRLIRSLTGYDGFDNNAGGLWTKYINIPITTSPSEYAQYKIVIDATNVTVYATNETQKAQGAVASDFWANVKSNGLDIRVFDQAKEQLYFWIEEFDYSNKKAVIWVKLEAGSSELNIACGNPSATVSSYNDPKQVFVLFDDFNDGVLDSKWIEKHFGDDTGGDYSVIETNRELRVYASDDSMGDDVLSYGVEATLPNLNNIVVEFRRYSSALTTFRSTHVMALAQSGHIEHTHNEHGNYMITNDGSSSTSGSDVGDGTTYTTYKLVFDGGSAKFYVDDVFKYSITSTLPTPPFTSLRITAASWGSGTSVTNYVDWIRVYKASDPADFGTPQIVEF